MPKSKVKKSKELELYQIRSLVWKVLNKMYRKDTKFIGTYNLDQWVVMVCSKQKKLKDCKRKHIAQYIKGWVDAVAVTVTNDQIRTAFQNTAEAIGHDILQSCLFMGEPESIPREVVYDYLDMHGGEHGPLVFKYLSSPVLTEGQIQERLNQSGVPKEWT